MFNRMWAIGLVRHRGARLLAIAAGIAIAVALIASLTGFVAAASATMTRQAIAAVTVDWQVQLASGAPPRVAIDELAARPGYTKLETVGYADSPGFEAVTGSSTQTTGPGQVIGLSSTYRATFPAQLRDLAGGGKVLLAQQTAANLHASPGDKVTMKRPGLDPVTVTIEGIVDLPLADAFFQQVGAPTGSSPQAPPDNVLILPLEQWHTLFDPVAANNPGAVRLQLHAAIPHALPADPNRAYVEVTGLARNYETRLAGAGIVGDNLAARLDAARADASYARVLFLFLGLPGVLLAGLLTLVVVASGAVSRRHDLALLRLRGATAARMLRISLVEVFLTGISGTVLGLIIAVIVMRLAFAEWIPIANPRAILGWAGLAALTGFLLAAMTILIPAWNAIRSTTIVQGRRTIGRSTAPWWERVGLDFILLAFSGLIFWQASRNGYQLVLAPEGVPSVAVSYTAFFAPLLLWAGAALFIMRLTRLSLSRGGTLVTPFLHARTGALAPLIGASFSRQRSRLATGLALVALAIAFAASTAIFNTTYEAQSLVDAELTTGADVTVSGGQAASLGSYLAPITAVPGVVAVQPMQHRFAYVGTDLQDLYGIEPNSLTQATRLSDAYFLNATARQTMELLAQTPDGVLVSPETVLDYQLKRGDPIKLRLQNAVTHQYEAIPFHYVGIAREFPTAPSDSFLVANAAYIAQQTGSHSVETLLVRTSDPPAVVAGRVRAVLGGASGATVQDIESQRRITNSSLTAVSLHGLTALELVFAIVLAMAGAGLVLALGFEERRRTLAIVSSLGATPRQLGAFIWGEIGLIVSGGLVLGGLLGWGLAAMLIQVLTHVFDPPPEHAFFPGVYLGFVVLATIAAAVVAGIVANRSARRDILPVIRSL